MLRATVLALVIVCVFPVIALAEDTSIGSKFICTIVEGVPPEIFQKKKGALELIDFAKARSITNRRIKKIQRQIKKQKAAGASSETLRRLNQKKKKFKKEKKQIKQCEDGALSPDTPQPSPSPDPGDGKPGCDVGIEGPYLPDNRRLCGPDSISLDSETFKDVHILTLHYPLGVQGQYSCEDIFDGSCILNPSLVQPIEFTCEQSGPNRGAFKLKCNPGSLTPNIDYFRLEE